VRCLTCRESLGSETVYRCAQCHATFCHDCLMRHFPADEARRETALRWFRKCECRCHASEMGLAASEVMP
jgi:hypothetical protein